MSNGTKAGDPKSAARSAVAGASASGGETQTITREDVGEVTLQRGSEVMLGKMTEADVAAFMNDGDSEFAPQIKSMEEFDRITGILEGYGPDTEFTQKDAATGKEVTRTVHTWILRAPKGAMRLSILSSVQLDAKLPPFIGDLVSIARGKDIKARNGVFRIANYMVKGPPVPGKQRSWSRSELAPRTIEATVNPAQLPAGQGDFGVPPAEGHEDAQA